MRRVRFLAVLLALVAAGPVACTTRLSEQEVISRLSAQLNLPAPDIRVRTISKDALPIARIDYGGAEADVRFRRQAGTWVIDAVARGDGWEPAATALPSLAHRLVEQARARWTSDVMPRYAGTVKLLVGWSELLGASCGEGLPMTEQALLALHGEWHRTLFPNRGVAFHHSGLFLRDGWNRAMRIQFSATRVLVTSAGADGKFDTVDDVRLLYARTSVRVGVNDCQAHYTIPGFVDAALGRPDAPSQWNCSDMLAAFKQARMLDIVQEPSR
ncbi:MAG: hypothetical protein ACM3NQ_21070 [Bacteroidales bacterium]